MNAVLICKKYRFILDRFRYNPISIQSKKLFPYIDTLHLYLNCDVEFQDVKQIVVWYPVCYSEMKQYTQYHTYTYKNLVLDSIASDDLLPEVLKDTRIKTLGEMFASDIYLEEFEVPTHITELDSYAFQNCYFLKSVTLCEGLCVIPNCCFSKCKQLTSIVFPTSVIHIESFAFESCGFVNITIPVTIRYIGDRVFKSCKKLKGVVISQNVQTIESSTFDGCESMTRVVLPFNLKTIKAYAFYNCKSLVTLNIPKSVCFVASNAFGWCESLKELTFSDQCYIGVDVFTNCVSLTKLIIPTLNGKLRNVVSKEEENIIKKFYNQYTLQQVCNNMHDENEDSIQNSLLQNVIHLNYTDDFIAKLSEIEKLKYQVELTGEACNNTNKVTSLRLPSNVTKICGHFFMSCDIKNIDLGNLREMGNRVFGSELQHVTIPTTLTQIGFDIFIQCTKLKSVELCGRTSFPGYVDLLEKAKLNQLNIKCSNLVVTFDQIDMFKYVEDVNICVSHLFYESYISQIVLPDNVCCIGISCFDNQGLLSGIVLPSKLTQIGEDAFQNCLSLKAIELPENLKMIGRSAFRKCGLTEIVIPKNVSCVGDTIFDDCFELKNYLKIATENGKRIGEVPDGVKEIAANCFRKYTGVDMIKIPKSVLKINNFSFSDSIPRECVLFETSEYVEIADLAFKSKA
ncbi:hypothetical protein EIN_327840 [Entamoeba invadens IP1]|uniref:Leucine rich repeat containing protein BspA family protein n=1 Tax=Entamoeba invadens IP1 TaxID=370355 RepID=A0A0A1TXL4_ENTIV|nr:hypothetical protein EIN_327840 [Entamoeba invadens IP1]ELP86127.1 hypothetical protein EIN_327840 [Entamoeba invadens IP1]|eukprot:XP_004185473.1 hypothetical protein EIN_327840 [Entamoeba invadens IP1]